MMRFFRRDRRRYSNALFFFICLFATIPLPAAEPFSATLSDQQLLFEFTAEQTRIYSATTAQKITDVQLINVSLDQQTLSIQTPRLDAEDNQVRIQHHPLLTEWYQQTSQGIEHGFTLQQPAEPVSKLQLQLGFSDNISIKLQDQTIYLHDRNTGRDLQYDKLLSFDAHHQSLPSHFSITAQGVQIEVDVRNATYPITIDPLFSEQTQAYDPNGESNDYLGSASLVNGNYVFFGSRRDNSSAGSATGSVQIYKNVNGSWQYHQFIQPLTLENYGEFGYSLAMHRDTETLFVGTYDSSALFSSGGKVYVLTKSGDTWSETAGLAPTEMNHNAYIGTALASDGDELVIASYRYPSASDKGAIWVYEKSGADWNQAQYIYPNDLNSGDKFGYSVAINQAQNLIAVGVPNDDDVDTDAGTVYLYEKSGGCRLSQRCSLYL